MKTVATLLTEHLKKFGVTHVFGIPGKAISPLVMESEEQGLKYVLCRHESGAGYIAGGYALGGGPLGAAFGTSGPGGTNMLTAAGEAKSFHLPVLFITGHPSIKNTGRALGQDSSIFGTDLVKMFEPVTLFSARVDRGDLFSIYFQHALEKACCGIKGPVHLSIPFDVLLEKIEPFELDLPVDVPTLFPDIDKLTSMLNNAKSAVMLLGKGVHLSKAYEEVMNLAEKWRIPVMTTPGGKGSFPTNHPLSLGGFGLAASNAAYDILRHGVDLMLVLGTKLSDMSLAGVTPDIYPKQIIQFDCNPTFVGKSIPVPTISVIGDLKYNIRELLTKSECDDKINISESFNTAKLEAAATSTACVSEEYLSAAQTMRILRKNLPDDTLIISDDGSHAFYAVRHLDIYKPGTFYFDDVFGAMGHAIGLAIGAKLAQPQRKVVCITGDGCLMMQGTEISTAVCNKIATVFVVLNNGKLDMVDKAMKFNAGKAVGSIFQSPLNACKFAQSLGATAFSCNSESEIEAAIKFALNNDGPTLVEVMVDPDEIPPTLSREK